MYIQLINPIEKLTERIIKFISFYETLLILNEVDLINITVSE